MSEDRLRPIKDLLDPDRVEAQQSKRKRYLWRRNLKLTGSLALESLREQATPWLALVREGFRRLLTASGLLLLLELIAALLHNVGFLVALDRAVGWATQWTVHTPSLVTVDQRLSLAVLTIVVAGIALPIYYSIVASVLRESYNEAPERVRDLFLADPLTRVYRRTVVTMGLLGILVLALGGVGRAPSSVTVAAMTALILVTISGLFVVWGRLVRQGDVARLAKTVTPRLTGMVRRVEAELQGPADPEALSAFRGSLARQLSILDDVARYAQESGATGAAGALRLARVVSTFASDYGPLSATIPRDAEWSTQALDQVDVVRSGGAIPTPQEQARVMPNPRTEQDPLWVERRLGTTCGRLLDLSLREEPGRGIEPVLEEFFDALEGLASSRSVERPLTVTADLFDALQDRILAGGLDGKVGLVVHDRIGALHAPCMAALGFDRPAFGDTADALRSQADDATPPQGGPQLKEEHEALQEELENEVYLEGEVVTPKRAIQERLQDAWEEDREQQALRLLRHIRTFYVEFGGRLAGEDQGPTALAGVVQAYHMLARLERTVGTSPPRRSPLDRERWEIEEGPVRNEVQSLREDLISLATFVLASRPLELPDEDYPDTIGAAFYYTADEATTRLTQGPWEESNTWIGRFVTAAFRLASETEQRGGGAAQRASPLQEAARLSGFVELWNRVHDLDPDDRSVDDWERMISERRPGDPDQERWDRLLAISTYPDWFSRPRYESRFNIDLEVWDALTDMGLANPPGSMEQTPPQGAQDHGDPLVKAASVDSEVLHRIDDYYWAITAEELGLDRQEVPDSVSEAARNLERWGWP